jgi:transcriptional regulator with PAS, ATPase and Fis domain
MREIDTTLARIAPYACYVLITGESGVGKEVTARRLHALAFGGETRPFVAVNCGAFADSLLESELFGHERGAFTGAVRAKRGVFEQADGGTLFLDEVSEMPLSMQVKLLRVLQDRKITRVGGDGAVEAEFRLICATHRDLRSMVSEGTFREDLFYRINVVHLHVPPLRERHEDIVWLADRFLDSLNSAHPERRRTWGLAARESLARYPWAGNVRELKHCVERAWILGSGATIELPDLARGLEPGCSVDAQGVSQLRGFLECCERSHIVEMLERHGWAIGKTAAALGISRKNLWERMRRLRIEAPGIMGG